MFVLFSQSLLLICILSQLHVVWTFVSHFFKINMGVILPSTTWPAKCFFPYRHFWLQFLWVSHIGIQFSLPPCYFACLRYRYSIVVKVKSLDSYIVSGNKQVRTVIHQVYCGHNVVVNNFDVLLLFPNIGHIFKGFVGCFYFMFLSCILVISHDCVCSFLCFFSRPTFLLASERICVFLLVVFLSVL